MNLEDRARQVAEHELDIQLLITKIAEIDRKITELIGEEDIIDQRLGYLETKINSSQSIPEDPKDWGKWIGFEKQDDGSLVYSYSSGRKLKVYPSGSNEDLAVKDIRASKIKGYEYKYYEVLPKDDTFMYKLYSQLTELANKVRDFNNKSEK